MSLTWGEFRQQIRRTLINDVTPDEDTGDYKWDNEQLRDCLWWALDTFCNHTAMATSTSFTGVTATEYTLPDNLFDGEPLDQTGRVYYMSTAGDKVYYDPVWYTDWLDPLNEQSGFWTRPATTLHLTSAPGTLATSVVVEYWAYYDHPYADSDTIDVPRWARLALAYLTVSHALSEYGLRAGTIAQWKARPDAGTPEHNPVEKTQKWYFDIYEREISRFSPQDRINHFRSSQ